MMESGLKVNCFACKTALEMAWLENEPHLPWECILQLWRCKYETRSANLLKFITALKKEYQSNESEEKKDKFLFF